MKKLTISDSTLVLALQDEIRRSDESRYDHRLHGILLVAQGMSCLKVSELLGDAPRTVQYWVRRFEQIGLQGLAEGDRSGRPSRLKPKHLKSIHRALRMPPANRACRFTFGTAKRSLSFFKRSTAFCWESDNAKGFSISWSSGFANRGP